MDPGMRRFWITFGLPPDPEPRPRVGADPWLRLRWGVGVTGRSLADALGVVRADLLHGAELPPVDEVVADVDVSTLDQDHVLPNIGVVVWRGVWWPPGFTRWKDDEPHPT